MYSEQRIRIGLCSDTHYWPNSDRYFGEENEQLQPWSSQIQQALLSALTSANLDLVLHLGDFTCGGGTFHMPVAEFYTVLEQTHHEFEALPIPYYALPGNHDTPPNDGDYSFCEQLLGLESGLGRTIDLPMARLVLLNAQGHLPEQIEAARPNDPVYGWVHQAELVRLEKSLATAGNRPVILFVHQLLRPWIGNQPWQDFYLVKNAPAVLDILAHHNNVKAVIQGHAHRLDVHDKTIGNCPCRFIVLPAIIEYPTAWSILDLAPDSLGFSLRPLPLPELNERSRNSGNGHNWRAGRPEWRDFTISLL